MQSASADYKNLIQLLLRIVRHEVQLLINCIYNKFRN